MLVEGVCAKMAARDKPLARAITPMATNALRIPAAHGGRFRRFSAEALTMSPRPTLSESGAVSEPPNLIEKEVKRRISI
jgi:hypothetical protein